MNSHEEQLVAELASGSLPLEEARRLEASLSEEAREMLAAHRLVLGAIAQSEEPAMTDIERARLHRDVAEGISEMTRELSATQIATPAVVTPKRARTIRWMRFASAAGAAALFIGVVAVGSQLGGGADSDSAGPDTTAAAVTSETSVVNEEFAAEAPVNADDVQGAEATDPVPTTTSLSQPRTLSLVLEVPSIDVGTEESDLEDLARAVTEATDVAPAAAGDLPCFDEALAAVDTEPEILVKGFTLIYLDQEAVGFQSQAVDDEEAIRIFDPETCEELATTPR